MSIKTIFLGQVEGRGLICAKLQAERRDPPDYNPCFRGTVSYIAQDYILKKGYTELELEAFLESLDFEHDGGFGCQELKLGLIWHTDKTWSERCECDGCEWGGSSSRFPPSPTIYNRTKAPRSHPDRGAFV